MKLPFDIPSYVIRQLDRGTVEVPVSIDIEEFINHSGLDEVEIDMIDLLHENGIIAHFLTVENVLSLRPDLSKDEAWEVLQSVEDRVADAPEYGMSFDSIQNMADTLYPLLPVYSATISVSIESDKVMSADDADAHFDTIAQAISQQHGYVKARYDRASRNVVSSTTRHGGQP